MKKDHLVRSMRVMIEVDRAEEMVLERVLDYGKVGRGRRERLEAKSASSRTIRSAARLHVTERSDPSAE